jgi:hypothetical protein
MDQSIDKGLIVAKAYVTDADKAEIIVLKEEIKKLELRLSILEATSFYKVK